MFCPALIPSPTLYAPLVVSLSANSPIPIFLPLPPPRDPRT